MLKCSWHRSEFINVTLIHSLLVASIDSPFCQLNMLAVPGQHDLSTLLIDDHGRLYWVQTQDWSSIQYTVSLLAIPPTSRQSMSNGSGKTLCWWWPLRLKKALFWSTQNRKRQHPISVQAGFFPLQTLHLFDSVWCSWVCNREPCAGPRARQFSYVQ